MRGISSLVAFAAASAACNIDQTQILAKFGWLLSVPTDATMDEKCADGGAAVVADLNQIVTDCASMLGDFSSLLKLAEDLICEKQENQYCLPVLFTVVPVANSIMGAMSGTEIEIDFMAFTEDPDDLAFVHERPNCARKIVSSATRAARAVAKANSWQINEEVEYIKKMVQGVLYAAPEEEDNQEPCAGKLDSFFTTAGALNKDTVCNADGTWMECARKLVSVGYFTVADNFCESTKDKRVLATATIELNNVVFSYYEANPTVIDTYLRQDLSAILPGILMSDMDISVEKKVYGDSVVLYIKITGYEMNDEITKLMEQMKNLLEQHSDLVTFVNLDLRLPDEAFVDPTLLTSGNPTVAALSVNSEAPSVAPINPTPAGELDGTTSAAPMLQAGIASGAVLAAVLLA